MFALFVSYVIFERREFKSSMFAADGNITAANNAKEWLYKNISRHLKDKATAEEFVQNEAIEFRDFIEYVHENSPVRINYDWFDPY